MVGELIMLPLRVGVRATQLWLRATEETVAMAAGATSRVLGAVMSRGSNGAAPARPDAPPEASQARAREAAAPEPKPPEQPASRPSPLPQAPLPAAETPPPARPPQPLETEPEHVSEEPTVVEEFAEPGAEEGAGPELHIEPPWDGYQEMNAKQVISRLASATSAELAAVQLYESSERRRQTILNAAQRELRARNGSGSPSQ